MIKKTFDKSLSFIRENKILSFCFLVVYIYFILQHCWALGWDFAAYVINARYFFNKGDYLEVARAPLMSLLLAGSVLFGKIGEYFYITFASLLFFFANFKLSSLLYSKFFYKYEIDKKYFNLVFFIFSLTPFVLSYGLIEGTELLGLAFFEIFLFYFIENRYFGHFLGLAVLTRYNFLVFFPFIFINRDYKKILKNLLLFILILSPWMIFNYIKWGNFFMSIIESYNLNILTRLPLMKPFNYHDLFLSINFLIIFLIFGLVYIFLNFTMKEKIKARVFYDILFLVISFIFLWDYFVTPFKIPRYLFNLSLPLAYFSTTGFLIFLKFFYKYKNKILFGIFIFWLILIFSITYHNFILRGYDDMYSQSAKVILDKDLKECYVASHHWVPLNYYTNNAYSLWKTPQEVINIKGIVVIFPQDLTVGDSFTLESIKDLPVLESNMRYIILAHPDLTSENCAKRFPYDVPAVKDPCRIISKRFQSIKINNIVEKGCLFFNKV